MQAVEIYVSKENLQTISEILSLYAGELYKITSPSQKIQTEIRIANGLCQAINEECVYDDNFNVTTVNFNEDYWALIYTLCRKYIDDKRGLLAIEKSTERIVGSTDEESTRLDSLENFLNVAGLDKLQSREALLKSFMHVIPANTEVAEKTAIQVQVGDVYGQMIVANNTQGSITQTSADPELIKFLQEFTKVVIDSPVLSPEQKNDALGDVQAIQAQITKTKPSKKVIQTLISSLSVLADATQVATAAVTFAPMLEKLQHFISSMPH